jgi:flagellar basal body-associated protein FliL
MSEETQEADGWSGIKKAIIAAITTAVTAGGAWFATHLGGGEEAPEAVKTEMAAPAPVVINVQQNQENKQQTKTGGAPTVIRERVIEKSAPAQSAPAKKEVEDEDPW